MSEYRQTSDPAYIIKTLSQIVNLRRFFRAVLFDKLAYWRWNEMLQFDVVYNKDVT